MKNVYASIAFLATVFLCLGYTAQAQQYVGSTGYDTINFNGDTLRFNLPGTPVGAHGTATLRVIYEGDFGDQVEFMTVLGEAPGSLGQVGPHPSNTDCAPEDSLDITFGATILNTWAANGSVDFRLTPSMDVDQFCVNNRVKVRLIYNYCAAGVPVQYASLAAADSTVCASGGPVALMGLPTGGTYSGPGVSGSNFDPSNLSPGDYILTYVGTDAIGCETSDDVKISVLNAPAVQDTVACPGTSVVLHAAGGSSFVWYDQLPLTSPLDTSNAFSTGNLSATSTFYVVSIDQDSSLEVTNFLTTNFLVVDHNSSTGDDRGGIAITPNYVYINGDNNCARYDAANLANGISLPMRDGIFSDLGTGKVWSFYNTTSNQDPSNPAGFIADAIIELDASLAFTSNIIPLDMPLTLGGGSQSMILAGNGAVGLMNGVDDHFYVVDIDQGHVEDVGLSSISSYGSENWADWGILEYSCSGYSILYRDFNSNIVRQNMPSLTTTIVSTFPNGVSDMASFTYSPWHNRWYFHYEGSSTTFGGSSETLGYADATATPSISCSASGGGCYSPVTVNVSTIDIGPDASGCEGVGQTYFAGTGFSSYTWNGVNTNFNTYTATTTGPVIFSGIDQIGCVIADTAQYTSNPNPVADFGFSVQGSGLSVLFSDLSTGTGAFTYAWDFGDGQNSTAASPSHTYAAAGQYDVCLTVTQANGCMATFCDRIILPAVGIAEGLPGSVSLFPNPARGQAVLRVALDASADLDLHILNGLGQLVHRDRFPGFSQGELQLDLSGLSAGIYMVRVRTEGGSTTLRLVVE